MRTISKFVHFGAAESIKVGNKVTDYYIMVITTRRWPKTILALVAIIAIILTTTPSYYATAQTIGKFASRAKSTTTTKKKKRSFFGANRKAVTEDNTTDDGELSWSMELFLAETKMIGISIITSILCAVMTWLWYSKSVICDKINVKKEKDVSREEGGE